MVAENNFAQVYIVTLRMMLPLKKTIDGVDALGFTIYNTLSM